MFSIIFSFRCTPSMMLSSGSMQDSAPLVGVAFEVCDEARIERSTLNICDCNDGSASMLLLEQPRGDLGDVGVGPPEVGCGLRSASSSKTLTAFLPTLQTFGLLDFRTDMSRMASLLLRLNALLACVVRNVLRTVRSSEPAAEAAELSRSLLLA
mmetsp:Transcript_88876/g.250801  ORF Transcript_88876/g.250801 Transcript_88876/m.250801 type:complete len:154 (-) Transcript_88876:8-469(-)